MILINISMKSKLAVGTSKGNRKGSENAPQQLGICRINLHSPVDKAPGGCAPGHF